MSSIYGTETFAIDAKGRVNIPARMRRGIHPDAMDTFLMLQGFEGCVSLYPLDEWRKREEELRKLPQTDSQTRLFQRRLLEHAQETTLDAQGRLTLSPALLALAGLRKEARIVGLGNHIEVWDPKRYQASLGSDSRTLEDLAKDLNW